MIPIVTRSLIMLVLLCSLSSAAMAAHTDATAPSAAVHIRVKIHPSAAYEHHIMLTGPEARYLLKDAQEESAMSPALLTDIYFTIEQDDKTSEYRLETTGDLWNKADATRLVLSRRASARLQAYEYSLREKHYGTIVPWSKASTLLPRKSIFTIVDMEKGLTFRVQRRAGSSHADVQPLTREDTKTMKHIFDYHWSWKRRSILIITDENQKIAASMNGMPHGGDGIPDNGFSGHFCVHFLDSRTHRSKHPDLFHQLMVYTAAGKRKDYLDSLSPNKLAEVFIGALSQRDHDLLAIVSEGAEAATLTSFVKELEQGTVYRIMSRKAMIIKDEDHRLTEQFRIPVLMKRNNQAEHRVDFQFELARESVTSPWKIRDVQVMRD